jgi:hypothetical protein
VEDEKYVYIMDNQNVIKPVLGFPRTKSHDPHVFCNHASLQVSALANRSSPPQPAFPNIMENMTHNNSPHKNSSFTNMDVARRCFIERTCTFFFP